MNASFLSLLVLNSNHSECCGYVHFFNGILFILIYLSVAGIPIVICRSISADESSPIDYLLTFMLLLSGRGLRLLLARIRIPLFSALYLPRCDIKFFYWILFKVLWLLGGSIVLNLLAAGDLNAPALIGSSLPMLDVLRPVIEPFFFTLSTELFFYPELEYTPPLSMLAISKRLVLMSSRKTLMG